MRVKQEREPAQCPHCPLTFIKPDHLVRHIRSHTKEKPFVCTVCDKSFGRRDVLLRHSRLHDVGQSANVIVQPVAVQSAPSELLAAASVSSTQTLPPSPKLYLPANDIVTASLSVLSNIEDDGMTTPGTTATQCFPLWNSSQPPANLSFPNILGTSSNSLQLEGFDAIAPTFDWHLAGLSPLFDLDGLIELPKTLDDCLRSRAPSPGFERETGSLALNELAMASAFDRIDKERIRAQWPGDDPRETGLTASLWSRTSEEAFSMPPSGFLAIALQLYFKRMHGHHLCVSSLGTYQRAADIYIDSFIHAATFSPMHHSPICLLSMCANGAQLLGTCLATRFSAQVHQRVTRLLRNRESNQHVDSTQSADILLCVALLLYAGGLQVGSSIPLAALSALHSESIALAQQRRNYAADGPTTYAPKHVSLDVNDAILHAHWQQWVRTECAKRHSFSLIFIDVWLHAILQDGRSPAVAISALRLALPCAGTLFNANDARSWAVAYNASMASPSFSCASIIARLFDTTRPSLPEGLCLDPARAKTVISLVSMHWRFRCIASESVVIDHDDQTPPRRMPDLATAVALDKIRSSVRLGLGEDLLLHLLCMWVACDVRLLETASGRRGDLAARAALATLVEQDWIGQPATRRAVLHAAHIYCGAVVGGLHFGTGEPYTIHHALAPFHACMFLFVYSTLAASSSIPPAEGEAMAIPLEDLRDWPEDLGMTGFASLATPASANTPLANFVLQGGAAMLGDEPLTSQAARSVLLLTTASYLEAASSWTCWPVGRVYASLLRLWLDAEMGAW